MFRKGKSMQADSKHLVIWYLEQEWELTADGSKRSLWGNKNGLKLDFDDSCTILQILTKIMNCTLKMGDFYHI